MCSVQGTCEPLIEKHLGLLSSIETINLGIITTINSVARSFTAGRTSLHGQSLSEVLAYKMGESPPSLEERNTNKAQSRKFLSDLEEKWDGGRRRFNIFGKRRRKRNVERLLDFLRPPRPTEVEVFSTDSKNQGVCSACSAFAVTSAFETCVKRIDGNAPTGLSQQNLLDCGFNTNGLAGCDGGKSFRYMQWLTGGGLSDGRKWPYVDGGKKFEVAENTSLGVGYSRRPGTGRCMFGQEEPLVALTSMVASWDEHTERDLENILLDGHAIVTTIEVTQHFQFYTKGVFISEQCQDWKLGHNRGNQWDVLRPLRHAVVIVGFGVDKVTGLHFWKVKNSWGPLWGESGFFRIMKGYNRGHCGLGAYFAVATRCRECSKLARCDDPKQPNLRPPANLPQEQVFLGQTKYLASPIAAQGALTSNSALDESQCPAESSCKVICGPRCQRMRGDEAKLQCCKPLGGRGQRVYCPRRGSMCGILL